MYCSSSYCKNISAVILDIGEPMDMPFLVGISCSEGEIVL
jgi:hypothetical protein